LSWWTDTRRVVVPVQEEGKFEPVRRNGNEASNIGCCGDGGVQRAAARKAEKEHEEERRIKTLLNCVTYFVALHQTPNPCFSYLISWLLHLRCACTDDDDEEEEEGGA
jgi:hypothetical protein